MAKKKAATEESNETALAPRDPNATELQPWEQRLLDKAKQQRESVAGIGGGMFASIKGGTLKINDNPVPGNAIGCVVLGHMTCKAWFEKDYDPHANASPTCYAYGRDGQNFKGMQPHAESDDKQATSCDDCPKNVFGTAKTGRGKACRDSFKIAIIQSGDLGGNGVFMPYGDNAKGIDRLTKADVVMMSIPATSLASFAAHVRSMNDSQLRPLFGVHTKIIVDKDQTGEYPTVKFECLGLLTEKQVGVAESRVAAAMDELMRPFPKLDGPAKPAAKAPAKKGKGGKF